MRVLLVTQYFPPEIGATQNRLHAFARALVDAGIETDVLTEVPNHPSGLIAAGYRGRWFDERAMDGFRVIRVRVVASPRKTFARRLAFYLSFTLMALAARPRLARRYDVVLATSPPLTAAAAGLALARLTRARFVLDVRDLWPLAAGALGELRQPSLLRAAGWLERRLYAGATRILVTTQAFARNLVSRGVPASRIVHVPNGAHLDVFRPDPSAAGGRGPLGLPPGFLVTYAGLHGIAQGLGVVLDAAGRLAAEDVRFAFIGEGPVKADLDGRRTRAGVGQRDLPAGGAGRALCRASLRVRRAPRPAERQPGVPDVRAVEALRRDGLRAARAAHGGRRGPRGAGGVRCRAVRAAWRRRRPGRGDPGSAGRP